MPLYVLTASAKFNDTLQSIVRGLQESGFSGKDYRKVDKMTEEERQCASESSVESFLFPEQQAEQQEHIDKNRLTFDPNTNDEAPKTTTVIDEIEAIAEDEHRLLEEQIKAQEQQPTGSTIFQEMGDKVKRYKVKEA